MAQSHLCLPGLPALFSHETSKYDNSYNRRTFGPDKRWSPRKGERADIENSRFCGSGYRSITTPVGPTFSSQSTGCIADSPAFHKANALVRSIDIIKASLFNSSRGAHRY